MNCPLCTAPMKFHRREFVTVPNPEVKGYADFHSCTSGECHCTVKMQVTEHEGLHRIQNGLSAEE